MLSTLEQQDFIDESIPNQEDLLLTTVIGIKCKDGVVIGTDSQFTETTYGTKSMTENKIHRINDFMILGGSGDVYHTNILVESLQKKLDNTLYSDLELRKKIMEKVLRPLDKEYNPDPDRRKSFYPISLLAARTKADCRLYVIRLPYIFPVEQYEVIGSGSPIARFLFKLNNRWLEIAHEKWSDRPVEKTEKTCGYMINEIKESDMYSGGKTRVTSIRIDGVNELADDDISKLPLDFVSSFIELASEIGKHPDAFKEIFMKSMSSR